MIPFCLRNAGSRPRSDRPAEAGSRGNWTQSVTGAFSGAATVDHLVRTIDQWLSSADHDRAARRELCRKQLLRFYTAENQRAAIEDAVEGRRPATFAMPPNTMPAVGDAARDVGTT